MQKIREISWFRVAAESAAIVVSILLAFAIDAWWADNLQGREELRTVAELKNQFRAHKELLERVIARQQTRIGIIESVLDMINETNWSSDMEGIDGKLGLMMVPNTTDFGSGALESLLSAGNIGLISDVRTRQRLVAWTGVRGEFVDDELALRNLITDQLFPYLARRGVPMAGIMDYLSGDSFEHNLETSTDLRAERTLEGNLYQLDQLFADPAFLTFVEQLYGFNLHALTEYERTMTAIDDMLALLDNYQ